MQLDVSHPDLWNKVYLDFIDNPGIYNVIYGGSGSGKSNFMHQRFMIQLLTRRNYRAYFFRKTRSSIRQSLWSEFKGLAESWAVDTMLTFYESRFEIKFGGNAIIMLGLDDEQKIKSLAPAAEVWLEEVNEFDLTEFTQVTLRLRGQSDEPKRFWLTFNPVDETHWLKARFFDNPPQAEVGQIKTLKTTYLNNKFLDKEYISRLNALLEVDPNYYNIYALGEWGQIDPERLFAPKFNKAVMTYERQDGFTHFENFDIYLSFDFNILNTCTVYQVDDTQHEKYEGTVYVLETIRMNDLEALSMFLLDKYGSEDIWVTGDASGFARSAYTKGNINAFQQIKAFMDLSDVQIKTPQANPSHLNSRIAVGSALVKYEWVILADANQELIADLLAAKVDAKMSLNEWKDGNPKMGHALDTFRYFVHTFLKSALKIK